jgi:hypothetical protein
MCRPGALSAALEALTIARQLIRVFDRGRAPCKGDGRNQSNRQDARISHRQLAPSPRARRFDLQSSILKLVAGSGRGVSAATPSSFRVPVPPRSEFEGASDQKNGGSRDAAGIKLSHHSSKTIISAVGFVWEGSWRSTLTSGAFGASGSRSFGRLTSFFFNWPACWRQR